ncbi:hypothetical protein ACOPJQ_10255 [Luteimonas dalianensis]|uniref:hypothetical protein n=1 Tax=Luteimonas dalianensis TaxID=1148196 RepID=UPI003BF02B14
MTQAPAYTVHEADPVRDRDLILGLWRGNLGDAGRMAAKYDWFYLQCPDGAPLTLLLRHEESGSWVGVASAGPRRMLYDGRTVLTGVLVDLTVLPAHRSLWPALSLQMGLMEAGARRFGLMYGFPNPKAAVVFKRVGYVPLCRMVRHARVLRHGDYVRRRLPAPLAVPAGWLLDTVDRIRPRAWRGGLRGRWQDRADEVLGALWTPASAGRGPIAIRDLAFLRWRFDASPLVQVRYLVVEDAGGTPQAWFACESRGKVLFVHDLWSGRGVAGPSREQLATLLRAAREGGYGSVSVEFGPAAVDAVWLEAGFIARESRPVFWHPSTVDTPPSWLTAADEDE